EELQRLRLRDAGRDLTIVDDRGVVPRHAELRAVGQLRPDRDRIVPGLVLTLPRMGPELRVRDRFVVLPLGIALDRERRARTAQDVHQPRLLDFPVLPLERALRGAPDAEVDADLVVVERVEDDVVLLPVLRLLDAEVLPLERPAAGEGLDLGMARVVLRLD